jgi:hypothetical protein
MIIIFEFEDLFKKEFSINCIFSLIISSTLEEYSIGVELIPFNTPKILP